jgi:hypothetical protein
LNYLPFAGYWFYGAGLITADEMAAFHSSYGLLSVTPTLAIKRVWSLISGFFNSNLLGG